MIPRDVLMLREAHSSEHPRQSARGEKTPRFDLGVFCLRVYFTRQFLPSPPRSPQRPRLLPVRVRELPE